MDRLKNKTLERKRTDGIIYLLILLIAAAFAFGFSVDSLFNAPQELDITMTSGRFERHFRIHIPESVEESYPVVVAFHGGFDTGPDFQSYARLEDYGDRLGMITVYPDGYGGSWANGYGSIVDRAGVDDIKFFNEIIEYLDTTYKINKKRIYAVGHSNGGMFCHRLAHENHENLTAFATVDATMPDYIYNKYKTPTNLPVLMINGDKDPKIPFDGSEDGFSIGVRKVLKLMLKNNECDPGSMHLFYYPDLVKDNRRVRRETYYNSLNQSRVELIVVENGVHNWFMEDAENNEVIMNFFSRYSK